MENDNIDAACERLTGDWVAYRASSTIGHYEDAALVVAAYRELLNQNNNALDIALNFGGIDGAHHKAWVIDQVVRALTGDEYEQIIKDAKAGEDGPDTYMWDEGIAP